jgi:hypothetical protein
MPPSQTQQLNMGGRQSSIGLRRIPSTQSLGRPSPQMSGGHYGGSSVRSSAGPLHLPTLAEERTGTELTSPREPSPAPEESPGMWNKVRRRVRLALGFHRASARHDEAIPSAQSTNDYDSSMVDVLDTVGTWPSKN